ncbi:MAG TPA: hypothetical protein VHT75_17095 [Acidimicrobiales bacterium]|jgi:hypothetical protein|nr:hypothetical protein [Acidimicrobiales bacterium]
MEPAAEQDMRQVAERTVGGPILAAGSFRTVADVEPFGGSVGALLAVGQWVWIKKRTRLPPYPFVVVTESEVIVLEFRFGSTLQMRRVVGRWPKRDIRVIGATPECWRAAVILPLNRFPVELEGAFHTDSERDVIDHLRRLLPES